MNIEKYICMKNHLRFLSFKLFFFSQVNSHTRIYTHVYLYIYAKFTGKYYDRVNYWEHTSVFIQFFFINTKFYNKNFMHNYTQEFLITLHFLVFT